MDCDYRPEEATLSKKESRRQRRKSKHIRTTFNEIIGKKKPFFDPESHKTFETYLDEYFNIDCEDFIFDLPCRYKYSQTIPNSYGLTIEEILTADDKELDRWCSMKRITQLQPEYKELNDVKVFEKRGQDEMLKRKILPSLYKTECNEDLKNEIGTSEDTDHATVNKNKRKRKISIGDTSTTIVISETHESDCTKKVINKKKGRGKDEGPNIDYITQKYKNKQKNKGKIENMPRSKGMSWNIMLHKTQTKDRFYEDTNDSNKHNGHKKQKAKNNKFIDNNEKLKYSQISDTRLQAYGIKPKKFKNKLKYGKSV